MTPSCRARPYAGSRCASRSTRSAGSAGRASDVPGARRAGAGSAASLGNQPITGPCSAIAASRNETPRCCKHDSRNRPRSNAAANWNGKPGGDGLAIEPKTRHTNGHGANGPASRNDSPRKPAPDTTPRSPTRHGGRIGTSKAASDTTPAKRPSNKTVMRLDTWKEWPYHWTSPVAAGCTFTDKGETWWSS